MRHLVFGIRPVVCDEFHGDLEAVVLSVSLRRTLANEFVPVLIVGNRQQFVIRVVGSEIRRYLHVGVIHVRHFFYDGVVVDSLYFEQNVPVFVERRDIAFALQKSEDILPDALLGEERGNRAENQEQGERKFLHADSFFLVLQ